MLRDKAARFEVKGGTGGITRMCVVDGCLEIYKIDKTFRVKSPDGLDPEKINPTMPWVITEHSDVGSSHPVVARILLQSEEILNTAIFNRELNKERILSILHDTKEQILKCERIMRDLAREMGSIEGPIKEMVSRWMKIRNPLTHFQNSLILMNLAQDIFLPRSDAFKITHE